MADNGWDAERIDELRRLAVAAEENGLRDNLEAFVAYSNETAPAAVLSLLDELERVRRERDVLTMQLRDCRLGNRIDISKERVSP